MQCRTMPGIPRLGRQKEPWAAQQDVIAQPRANEVAQWYGTCSTCARLRLITTAVTLTPKIQHGNLSASVPGCAILLA